MYTRIQATRIVILILLLCMALAATLAKIAQFYGFHVNDWDTGIYANVIWNLSSGDGFYSDVRMQHQLGEHFSPIIIIFVPLFMIAPSPVWLVAGQGLAVGVTYVLIYYIGLKIFGDANTRFAKPLALSFAILAFFYRPLTSALLFEFHPSTLATPLLAAAILALLHRRDRLLWILVSLLLLSKENAPLAILGLGCYAALVLSRSRLGVALMVASAVSATVIIGVAMPYFQTGPWSHYSRLGPLTHWHEKAAYLYTLVRELAFLPLASWRSLLCAVPLVALNLAVAFSNQFSIRFHYDDFASVFLLVAAIHGTVNMLNAIDAIFRGPQAIFSHLFIAMVAVFFIAPERYSPLSEFRRVWPGKAERQLHRELARYRGLPLDIGIAADSALGPHLSSRQRYVAFPSPAHYRDLKRLWPGDKVLITPIRRIDRFTAMKRLLDQTPGLVQIYASAVLYVYEVTSEPDT